MHLSNVCNSLEVNIELTSPKDEDCNSRAEHYPSPYIDFQGTYTIGLVNNHYLINDTADLIAYGLEHCDEVKDIAGCHLIYKQTGKYYNKDKSGKRFIKAFHVFKLLQ